MEEEEVDILAAGEAAGWLFRRPTTGSAHAPAPSSPHVYVSNVVALSDDALRAAAEEAGRLLRVTRTPPKSGGGGAYEAAVLSFASTAAGCAARARLDGACLGGSAALSARFADLAQPPAEEEARGAAAPVHADAAELRIPGLALLLDWVSEAEEAALLAYVDRPGAPWTQLARRRVLHEGHAFDYQTRRAATEGAAAPAFGPPVAAVAARLAALPAARAALAGGPSELDQLTVNDYACGTGIAAHCDTHSAFAPLLASLSLAGSCAIEFAAAPPRAAGGPPAERSERRSLHLPRRSLLLLAGEARYGWTHAIPTRRADRVVGEDEPRPRGRRRVSLTFRQTAAPGAECRCGCDADAGWPLLCDSALAAAAAAARAAAGAALASAAAAAAAAAPPPPPPEAPGDAADAPELERRHVWALYDAIAPHFSATRVALWPAIAAFLRELPPRCLLLDVGCGNGKYLAPAAALGHALVGLDVSLPLLRDSRRRLGAGRAGLARADCAAGLPCRPSAFDAALLVAVLHHVSSGARRRALLAAVRDALRPGGVAAVTAWAAEQEAPERTLRKWRPIPGGPSGDYFVPWHVPLHRPEAGAAAREAAAGRGGEAPPVLDDAKRSVVYQRYVHLFCAGELGALARSVPGLRVEKEFFDASNWVVLLRKEG